MNILSKHIIKTVVAAILFITLVLMGIEVLIAFIGELSNIGTGNYGSFAALKFVILDMPYQLNILFPMAGLVGSLIGLSQLANQSELIVMRAAGYSTMQISLDVIKAAAITIILATIIGEGIAPYAENLALMDRTIAKSGGQAFVTQQGIWLRQGKSFIEIDNIASAHQLSGITVYKFDMHDNLIEALRAQSAIKQDHQWILQQVDTSEFTNNKVISKHSAQLIWPIQLNSHVIDISQSDPRNMSLVQLGEYIHYLKQNGLQANNFQLTFWKRIFQPLTTVVMIFLAVPFILGPLRTVTMGVRIITGIAVGFIFFILNQFFSPITTLYQIPPVIGALMPLILFSGLGYFLLGRVR